MDFIMFSKMITLAVTLLLLAGGCSGQTVVEAVEGDRVTLTCYTSSRSVSWTSSDGTTTDTLYLYESYGGDLRWYNLSYPEKHVVENNSTYFHNLVILSAEMEDALYYTCTSWYTYLLHVYSKNNTHLVNQVQLYNSYWTLAYFADMSDYSTVQWTFQTPNGLPRDIYYGTRTTGGMLVPDPTNRTFPSAAGYGFSGGRFSSVDGGKYKYFFLDLPSVTQKEISVSGTGGLECEPAQYIIRGNIHRHICEATVSEGDLIPEFTLFRDDTPVQGSVIMDPTPISEGRLWRYTYSFTADQDDVGIPYTCNLKFRYGGPATGSPYIDTSNPSFEQSCTSQYEELEYSAQNAKITPNSEDGPLIIRVGDLLNCTAEGFPEVDYQWFCGNSANVSFTDQGFVVPVEFFNEGVTSCRCLATNRLSDNSVHLSTDVINFETAHESGVISPKENSVVVAVGERVKLDCTLAPYINSTSSTSSNNSERNWDFQWGANLNGDLDIKHILYRFDNRLQSSVLEEWQDDFEDGESRHDLVMKSGRFDLGGTYRCETIAFPTADAFETQVVVAAPVQCITPQKKLKSGEVVDLVCRLEFGGAAEPAMAWYADDDALLEQGNARIIRTKKSKVKEVTIQVKANPDVIYSCGAAISPFTDSCKATIEFESELPRKEENVL